MRYDQYLNKYEEPTNKYNRKQHNIMALVGNGFDIQVLEKYRPDDAITTKYDKFFDFLTYDAKDKGKREDWADFEELMPQADPKDISSIQKEFSKFLNQNVTVDIENNLGEDAQTGKWTIRSLSKFLGDLDDSSFEDIKFRRHIDYHDVFNFLFMNFNYTDLLDNYLYLDKHQFVPQKHKYIGTNFEFYINPNAVDLPQDEWYCNCPLYNDDTNFSSYVMSKIVHPHGEQSIPRSLLFGTNEDDHKTSKKYWAQYDVQYADLFDDTELFILFGMSVGETDKWWWQKISEALSNSEKNPELIIYNYDPKETDDADTVKQHFLSFAPDDIDTDSILDKIFVVNFNKDSDLYFLSLKDYD